MNKKISSMQLAENLAVEVARNRMRIIAINELLIEKGIYTKEEANDKFTTILDERTEEIIREILGDLENDETE
ncbi:hypothetical protein NiCM35_18215 [Niallia circulans]|uniref:hypothetical protein n=1 Tax=Niallia circulans TaxID=1397 RepID=UPI003D96D02A